MPRVNDGDGGVIERIKDMIELKPRETENRPHQRCKYEAPIAVKSASQILEGLNPRRGLVEPRGVARLRLARARRVCHKG